jgi:hypothetical protein
MMMDGMTSGMMWGMGSVWLLVIIVLLLAAAALIKYLTIREIGNEEVRVTCGGDNSIPLAGTRATERSGARSHKITAAVGRAQRNPSSFCARD